MHVQCSLFDYFNRPLYKPAKAVITFISVCEKAKNHEIAYIPLKPFAIGHECSGSSPLATIDGAVKIACRRVAQQTSWPS